MGLEKELWCFQQNENSLATRSEQSDKILLHTSGVNPVYFAVPFSLGWGSRRKELPKEWQGHVHSDEGKCPFWASPSSTLLTSCCCWTVGSWMLQIKITSLASQNNPSSLQGSDHSRCRDSELWLMKLGAHSHRGPRAVQIALDALGSCVPPRWHPHTRMGAVRGCGRLWDMALCWPGRGYIPEGDPWCCSLPALPYPAMPSRLGGFWAVWTLSGAGHSHHRPAVRTGSACSPCTWKKLGQTLPSCWNQEQFKTRLLVIFYLKGCMCAHEVSMKPAPSVRSSRTMIQEQETTTSIPSCLALSQRTRHPQHTCTSDLPGVSK